MGHDKCCLLRLTKGIPPVSLRQRVILQNPQVRFAAPAVVTVAADLRGYWPYFDESRAMPHGRSARPLVRIPLRALDLPPVRPLVPPEVRRNHLARSARCGDPSAAFTRTPSLPGQGNRPQWGRRSDSVQSGRSVRGLSSVVGEYDNHEKGRARFPAADAGEPRKD